MTPSGRPFHEVEAIMEKACIQAVVDFSSASAKDPADMRRADMLEHRERSSLRIRGSKDMKDFVRYSQYLKLNSVINGLSIECLQNGRNMYVPSSFH